MVNKKKTIVKALFEQSIKMKDDPMKIADFMYTSMEEREENGKILLDLCKGDADRARTILCVVDANVQMRDKFKDATFTFDPEQQYTSMDTIETIGDLIKELQSMNKDTKIRLYDGKNTFAIY